MNDMELLELAAKAAGYQIEWVRNSGCYYRCEEDVGREEWGPLDDNGDALCLAISLKIDVTYFDGLQMVRAEDCNGEYRACDEDYGDDIPAAVRRAIVRAAAMQASVGE